MAARTADWSVVKIPCVNAKVKMAKSAKVKVPS